MTKTRLNDLQLVLLSNAAGRDNGSLLPLSGSVASETVRANKAIEQLIKKGLVEEQPGAVRTDMWREDADQAFRLLITDTGRAAINAGEEQAPDETPAPAPAREAQPAAPADKPERNTKRSQLIALLSREDGASLDELVAAFGWLPHTTRAAMTGLRKAGMTVDSEKVAGIRRYRITEAG